MKSAPRTTEAHPGIELMSADHFDSAQTARPKGTAALIIRFFLYILIVNCAAQAMLMLLHIFHASTRGRVLHRLRSLPSGPTRPLGSRTTKHISSKIQQKRGGRTKSISTLAHCAAVAINRLPPPLVRRRCSARPRPAARRGRLRRQRATWPRWGPPLTARPAAPAGRLLRRRRRPDPARRSSAWRRACWSRATAGWTTTRWRRPSGAATSQWCTVQSASRMAARCRRKRKKSRIQSAGEQLRRNTILRVALPTAPPGPFTLPPCVLC